LDPPPPRAGGPLPVVVRHDHHCPLLLRVSRDAAEAARALGARATVDEADARAGDPAGVIVGGRAIAYAPIPPAALADGMRRAAACANEGGSTITRSKRRPRSAMRAIALAASPTMNSWPRSSSPLAERFLRARACARCARSTDTTSLAPACAAYSENAPV